MKSRILIGRDLRHEANYPAFGCTCDHLPLARREQLEAYEALEFVLTTDDKDSFLSRVGS